MHIELFADETRLAIILLLEQQERTVNGIIPLLNKLLMPTEEFSQPAVSHQKKLLLTQGFIEDEFVGRERPFNITQVCATSLRDFRSLLESVDGSAEHTLSFERGTVTLGTLETAASRASILAQPLRMSILKELTSGRQSVSPLCAHFNMTQPAMSHHLAALLGSKFVDSCREGKKNFYSLTEFGRAAIRLYEQLLAPDDTHDARAT
jgi:DNA-binding transcriptional ArsR family regulator